MTTGGNRIRDKQRLAVMVGRGYIKKDKTNKNTAAVARAAGEVGRGETVATVSH